MYLYMNITTTEFVYINILEFDLNKKIKLKLLKF